MKKIMCFMGLLLLVSACANEPLPNRETRSTTFVGQSVADLYENFGAPDEGIWVSDNERYLIYHNIDIVREWAYSYYNYCNITFLVKDDRVESWNTEGNQCVLFES